MWYTHYLLLIRGLQISHERGEPSNAASYGVDESTVFDTMIGEGSPICLGHERRILILIIGIKIFTVVYNVIYVVDCGFCQNDHSDCHDHANDGHDDGCDLHDDADDAEQSFHIAPPSAK